MKFKYTFLIAFLLPLVSFSQKYAARYKKQLEPNSSLINSGVNFTVEKLANGQYMHKTYYPENKQVTKLATFKSKYFKVKHGAYVEYYDDGTLVKQGTYSENKKSGAWIESDWYGTYDSNQRIGKWEQKKRIDGVLQVRQTQYYERGKLQGVHTIYDSLGNISAERIYENGVLVSEDSDSTQVMKVVDQMPRFPGCEDLYSQQADIKECADKALLQYIYTNIKYPKKAIRQNAQGEALVSFVINKDGSIDQIKVLRGVTKEIAKECVRLIKRMPPWRPGMIDNQPVKVQFNLPVSFRLQ